MKLGRLIEFQQLGLNQAESKSFWTLVFTPDINTGSAVGYITCSSSLPFQPISLGWKE
ncbi:hypothetical protein CROQUDRAFT_657627 [Cronartium quercuum f. sp. fusiforme G11]|uniref:Uncharacterized protein n=1 Tax=Cronartium quercuum f. sp. fusiforme G11 TaxID=708437 RepID=A0A9P6TC51_9BASI|nr:hypothetical protein CROQUDRAFT_657627 [Cronartium quercuum f. sp. fusiforme G11]